VNVKTVTEASIRMLIIFRELIDADVLGRLSLVDVSNLSESLVFNVFGRRRSNIPIRSLKTATSWDALSNLIEESLGIIDLEYPNMLEQDYSGRLCFRTED
jgi:hypothetical protein